MTAPVPAPPTSPTVMFLSVDMVRSKELKTAYIRRRESWLPLFRDLFETFPLVLIGKVALRFADDEHIPEYRVWKTLGDEIVFSTPERDGKARTLLLGAFHDAVAQFDGRNKEMGGYGIKGCAWNVVLDGLNETIAIPEMASADGAAYEDIIGPDVDFGFVIAKHGSGGQTIVDADLGRLIDAFGGGCGLQVVAHTCIDTPFRVEGQSSIYRLSGTDGG